MSGKNNLYGNAFAESFLKTLLCGALKKYFSG